MDVDVGNGEGVTRVGEFRDSELPDRAKFDRNRFPARAVLQAMEDIRNHSQEKIARSKLSQRTAANWVDQSSLVNCTGGNEALHWSDISMHYYCQLGNARNCYTNYIRAHAQPLGEEVQAIGEGKSGAGLIVSALVRNKIMRVLEIKKELVLIRSQAFQYCKATALSAKLTNAPMDPQSEEAEWAWLTENTLRENVFRFLMEAPTFSFDYDIQQRILNIFYRVVKDGTVDPNSVNPDDCTTKRPPRAVELTYNENTGEYKTIPNYCMTSKVLLKGLKGAHR
jgi:hypothetical protein